MARGTAPWRLRGDPSRDLCPISIGIQEYWEQQHWTCTSRFHDHPSPYILYFFGTVIYGNACNLA